MKVTIEAYEPHNQATVEGEDRFVTLKIETINGVKYELLIEIINEHCAGFFEIQVNALKDLEEGVSAVPSEKWPSYYHIGTPGRIEYSPHTEEGKPRAPRVVTKGTLLNAIREDYPMGGIWINWKD